MPSLHDWQNWYDHNNALQHTLVVTGDQDAYVRQYIYSQRGEKGTFSLHFEDLKFSTPSFKITGHGSLIYKGYMIFYNVKHDETILRSDNRDVLVKIVCDAIDAYV